MSPDGRFLYDLLPGPGKIAGFEVDGLQALCKKLQDAGVEFSVPYRRVEALGLGIAFFTDPWGTFVELTEGLDAL